MAGPFAVNITTPGTPITIVPTPTAGRLILIQARSNNFGSIFLSFGVVGGPTLTIANSHEIFPSQQFPLILDEANKVLIDGTNGDGVIVSVFKGE